jgi:hypothetical protein
MRAPLSHTTKAGIIENGPEQVRRRQNHRFRVIAQQSFCLILHRRNRFEIVRNRQRVFFFHVFESRRDHFGHEALDIVQIRFGSGEQQFCDVVAAPISDAGPFVQTDIRDLCIQRSMHFLGAREITNEG